MSSGDNGQRTTKASGTSSTNRTWKIIDLRQAGILADRYLDTILGDMRNTLLLLVQAPLIAALIVLRWREVHATDSLFFIFSLTSVWFGCINASREVVKERRIFMRERMINLQVGAYLFSKLRILAILSFIQCLTLIGIVHYYVHLDNLALFHFLNAYLTSLAGTTLGLLISSWAGSVDKAVGLVPLVIIPQILFSKFVLPAEYMTGAATWVEKLMIVRWSYQVFEQLRAASPDWWKLALGIGFQMVFLLVFFLLAVYLLRGQNPLE
ncbi:ABC transporter permease [bacterium]|nr:ABC transporter permease [candidate division CSSED10-310 bacterium]